MPWFKALRNARVGKARYAKGAIIELDAASLAGKADNFEPCDGPSAAKPKKSESKKPEKAAPAEAKPAPAPASNAFTEAASTKKA